MLGALCSATPPATVADLCTRTGYAERDVQRALAVLGGAGLLRGGGGLVPDLTPIRSAVTAAVSTAPIGRLAADYPRLDGCLKNGRVARIPVDDGLKAELGRLVTAALPPHPVFTEPELTALLTDLGDEPVALRRLLVDFGYLDREPDGSRYVRRRPAEP